jgi:hypothetical protein
LYDELLVWKGTLKLPPDWPVLGIRLDRGTEIFGNCDGARLSIETIEGGPQCIEGFWSSYVDGVLLPLPKYPDGWKFGTVAAPGPKALVTRPEVWKGAGVSDGVTCSISFGATRDVNPLP